MYNTDRRDAVTAFTRDAYSKDKNMPSCISDSLTQTEFSNIVCKANSLALLSESLIEAIREKTWFAEWTDLCSENLATILDFIAVNDEGYKFCASYDQKERPDIAQLNLYTLALELKFSRLYDNIHEWITCHESIFRELLAIPVPTED